MEVSIARSNRKTIGICVNDECTVMVRAPRRTSKAEIARVLKKHEPWIERQVARILPDYKTAEAWLKNEGQLLLMSQRM